jgi:2-oxoglutarate ferredoxin oxidoreductase subunit gamma
MDEESTGIRLAGLGGQGVVLTGLLLGHAAVREGLYAAGSSSYGAQSRGSLCRAEVVISRAPIDYPHVELANLFVAMSQEGYDAYASRVVEGGEIFYDAGLASGLRGNRNEIGFDVTAISMNELKDRQAANMIWAGILAGATVWFSERSLEEAIRAHIPERFLNVNLRALKLGILLGRDWKER